MTIEETKITNSRATPKRKSKPIDVADLFKQPEDKEAFDPSTEVFMSEVASHAKDTEKLKKYIVSELRRVIAMGKSPIKAIYQNQQYVDYCGSKIILEAIEDAGISHVWLKLTTEAASGDCPHRDPHGSLLNAEYRGKVLVAKVGNAGGRVGDSESNNPIVTNRYTGTSRNALFSTRKAYETEVLTEEPKYFPIHKAMLIMAQWGYGIKTKRMIRQDVNKFQDQWLVEECKIEETYDSLVENGVSDKYINGI